MFELFDELFSAPSHLTVADIQHWRGSPTHDREVYEEEIYERVLKAIANGAVNAQALARAALGE